MKKYIITVILLAVTMNSFSSNIRNILGYSLHYYSYGDFSNKIDETFLCKILKNTTLLVSYSLDQRTGWINNTATLGAVNVLDSNRYVETTYGFGIDSDLKLSHILGFDFSNETSTYLTNLGYKYSLYPDRYVHSLQFGFGYYKTHPFQIWTKTYVSLDSNIEFSVSEWIDLRYQCNDFFKLNAGGTIGIPESDIFNSAYDSDLFFYSIIAGTQFIINTFSLKYNFQYLFRESYTDMENTIVLDIKL